MAFYELREEPEYLILLFDMWRVSAVGKHNFAILTSIGPVSIQHGAYLRDHRLCRVDIRARPAGNGTELPKKAKVEWSARSLQRQRKGRTSMVNRVLHSNIAAH